MSDTTNSEHDTKASWRDKTLKTAGYSYVVGDAAMAVAGGLRGKDWGSSVLGAGTWLLGGVAAARYGNPDIGRQLQIQASKLEDHLKKKGVTIPDDAREQSALLTKKSVWQQVEQFMYEHPSELLNGMYLLGSGILLRGAIKNDLTHAGGKSIFPKALTKEAFSNVSSKFWIGAMVAAGAGIGLFVKEDPKAEEKAKDGGFVERAIAFVKEKPLRASAGFYTVNNGFLALQAWQDFEARTSTFAAQTLKPHHASTLQLAAYLLSNALLFSSSRSQITKQGFGAQDMASLEHAAASVIAAQPPQMQQALLADISQFMATQQGVTLDATRIAHDLGARITQITGYRMQEAVRSFAANEQQRRDVAAVVPPTVA